jgi:DNA adenine methylase
VKWVGGKRQLLPLIKENLPAQINRYLEVFFGGGALFFNIEAQSSIINDINPELINVYQTIKDQHLELIKKLKKHKLKHSESYYYKVRALLPREMSRVERAARFIYLNKTCFNGLYRENSKGQFNVPCGRYTNPNIVDEENIQCLNKYFKETNVIIENMSYQDFLLKHAQAGDFIYLDPPYFPLKKNSFTKYNKTDFLENEQIKLANLFKELDQKGCKLLLSNSNTSFIKKLYKDFKIIEVSATRAINSNGQKRAKAKIEVLVKNY